MSTFIYTLLVLGHIWSPSVEDPANPKLMMWWKWCSYLWNMIFWWNVIITICFWGFILPTTDFELLGSKPWGTAKLCLDHILPISITLIDWTMNAFVYDRQQIYS